jgi:hypothetical protein
LDARVSTIQRSYATYAGMGVGGDNGLVVDLDYEPKAPYVLKGTVRQVIFDLKPAIHDDEHAPHSTQASRKSHPESARSTSDRRSRL